MIKTFLQFVIILFLIFYNYDVSAADYWLYSRSSAQINEIRGFNGYNFLQRRRIVEQLGFNIVNIIPGEKESDYDGIRLSSQLFLNIDLDFGADNLEFDSTMPDSFVPGYQPYRVDLTNAVIELKNIAHFIDLTLGRQFFLEPAAWNYFDGAKVTFHTPWYFSAIIWGGTMVTNGFPFSYSSFQLDGVIRINRSDIDSETRSDLADISWQPGWGIALKTENLDLIRAEVSLRQIWDLDQENTEIGVVGAPINQMAGALIEFDWRWLNAGAQIASELTLAEINEAHLFVGYRILPQLKIIAEYQLWKPVFSLDSIFNVFWLETQNDVGLRLNYRPYREIELEGYFNGRIYSDLEYDDKDTDVDWGGGGSVVLRFPYWFVKAHLQARNSDNGLKAGVDITGGYEPIRTLSLNVRFSLWRFEDELLTKYYGNNVGYSLGAKYQISSWLSLLGEYEHNYNRIDGNQFRSLILMQFGLWL